MQRLLTLRVAPAVIGLLLSTCLPVEAAAQPAAASGDALPANGGAGLRSGAITSTGATVPNPRAMATAPRSSVDRDIRHKDAGRTNFGICKGC